MAKNTTLYASCNPVIGGVSLTDSDGTSLKTVYSAPNGPGDEGIRVMGITITTDSASATDVLLFISDGSIDYPIHHVDVPLGAGTDGTNNAVDALNLTNAQWMLRDSNNNRYFDLAKGWAIKAKMRTGLAGGKTLNITVIGAEYKM